MDIITKILDELDRKGLTQKDLTDFLGLAKTAFSEWKKGKSKSYMKYLPKIAEYLEVSTDYLFGNEQKETPTTNERDRLKNEIIQKMSLLNESNLEIALKQIAALIEYQEGR